MKIKDGGIVDPVDVDPEDDRRRQWRILVDPKDERRMQWWIRWIENMRGGGSGEYCGS